MSDSIRDIREKDWFWIDNALLRRDGKALGACTIAVYCVLASYADGTTQVSFPGMRTIAKMLGMSPATVCESVKALEVNGWISVERRKNEKTGAILANRYIMLKKPVIPAITLSLRKHPVIPTITYPDSSINLQKDIAQPKEPKASKPRPRNPIFDAFAEVCKLDPKTAGSFIAKYALMVKEAGYSPDDVRKFGKIWATRSYPGGATDGKPPTPANVAKYIVWANEESSDSPDIEPVRVLR